MIRYFSAQSEQTGAFNSTDRHVCWIIVPFSHRLISARIYTTHIAILGAVNIGLRQADLGDARTGVLVGELIENVDMVGSSDIWVVENVTLLTADMGLSPARRIYHVMCDSSNSSDRFDEPQLLLEVDDLTVK